ncbi:TRF2-interacting telomeric protein/Rap1 C terminal domain-containing protein [Xylaria cf. heliscus]|nr:TRF2-interacting telomeric protein/Rap1 C terminal domain-containing protein [Xylaria cf. heliscus]
MSAPGITYSGVLAGKHADDRVNVDIDTSVFKGLKFWLSARVPLRKFYVDTIQENGGEVVPKEGNADMLICNPANGPAPGSYSYELIADAIRAGSLNIKNNYICNTSTARRPKVTRNRFTEADDKALMRFVIEMERQGENIGGNNIYKEFEEKHPHHPWQSWRDRWAKKLRNIPRPPDSDSDGEWPPQQKGTSVASRQGASSEKSLPAKTRARFTTEEDDILLETIRHTIENHEAWNGYEPYKRLASEFPQRTYTSWRDHALNHVAVKNKDQIAQWEIDATFHPSDEEGDPTENIEDQQTQPAEDKTGVKSPAANQASNNATVAPAHTSLEKESSQRDNDDINTGLPPIPRAGSSEASPSAKLPSKGNAPNYSPSSPMLGIPQHPDRGVPITTKEQFYRDYNTFLETSDITDRRIMPSVAGQAIALWDLWQSVRSKKIEAAELDWQQIAEDLGFNWVLVESAPEDLRQCYETHLAPFADAMMSFNDSSDEEEDSTEDNADAETEGPLPSSPPLLPSLKRPLAAINPVYKHLFPQSSPKRRRLDRSDEIPSTPEHTNRTWNLRSSNGPNKTPTTSPLADYRVAKSVPRARTQSSARDEEDDEMRDGLADLPVQPLGRKRRLEPETQDFNFDLDTQSYAHDEAPGHSDNESQKETTPSQQLLQEEAESPDIKRNATILSASRQKIVQTTPTPRRRIRGPFQSDGSDDDSIQQTRKSTGSVRAPPSTQGAEHKRRTLPASWVAKSLASTNSQALRDNHPSSTTVPETEPQRRPSPPKETPDDIIDYFISLGYTRDIVLRSLKATSWIIGNAGQVMEMMKQGEPLPPRTTGVWTQRDDESLALVYSNEPPSDAKGEKKRAKEMKRLQAKHGPEQIALRKRYLLDEVSG